MTESYMRYKFIYGENTPAEAKKSQEELTDPPEDVYANSCWLDEEDFKDLAESLMKQGGSVYPVQTTQHVTADSSQYVSEDDQTPRTVITVEKYIILKGIYEEQEVIQQTIADFISRRWGNVFHIAV